MISKSMVCVFCCTIRQYGSFLYLNQCSFRARWYLPIEISHAQKLFSCSQTGTAPAWPDSENFSSTFHLDTLREEIDFGRKYGEQKNAYWSPKFHNMRNRRIRVCSSFLKLRKEIMRIYLSLAIRQQKSRCRDYAKHNRSNKIN